MTNRQIAVLCASIILACSGYKYVDEFLGRGASFSGMVKFIYNMLEAL